jgi:hypothetical protein
MSLAYTAEEIVLGLRSAGFKADEGPIRQVLALAEEAGECVGAYRRWSGMARRTDTFEHFMEELADVVITAYVTAAELKANGHPADLDYYIQGKLSVVFSRGWREDTDNGHNTNRS